MGFGPYTNTDAQLSHFYLMRNLESHLDSQQ